ncbi:MAG: rhomboid family intramembrane serine protease [Planctomycetaceae bacterium]
MGLEDRDYLRDESRRYSSGSGFRFAPGAPMCRYLLIITIAVFLLQIFSTREPTLQEIADQRDQMIVRLQEHLREYGDPEGAIQRRIKLLQQDESLRPRMVGLTSFSIIQKWLEMETPKVLSGQVWRLLTYAFCHDRYSIGHIVFNMLLLFWFGPRLESMYGSREFLLFYLTSAITAGLCYLTLDLMSGTPTPMIGASGAIMAIITLYACHFPTQIIYVMFIIPVEIRWVVLIYAIYDLHPLLMRAAGEPMSDNVAHAAHLGGMAFGWLYAHYQFRISPWAQSMETWWKAKQRGLRVVRAEPRNRDPHDTDRLADDMDRILKKISEHGEASLTSAERKTLERVSRELRNRPRS